MLILQNPCHCNMLLCIDMECTMPLEEGFERWKHHMRSQCK